MRGVPILRSEYHQLGEAGLFEGRRVELVSGNIIDLRPMSASHRTALRVLSRPWSSWCPAPGT